MKSTLLTQLVNCPYSARRIVAVGSACLAVLASLAASADAQTPVVSTTVDSTFQLATTHVEGSYVGDLSQEVVDGGVIMEGSLNGTFVGDCQPRRYGQPDLFYNFYTQGYCNRANAQMYISPLPVPPNVGHTFNTYQPFYPHHFMYWHKDRYHRYYDNGRGMNRTRATYYSPPVRQAVSNLYWNYLRIPR